MGTMNASPDKRFYHKRLLNIEIFCSSCKGPEKSNSSGYAYEASFGEGHWVLEFHCKTCNEYSRVWNKEYNALIMKVLEEESPTLESDYQNR